MFGKWMDFIREVNPFADLIVSDARYSGSIFNFSFNYDGREAYAVYITWSLLRVFYHTPADAAAMLYLWEKHKFTAAQIVYLHTCGLRGSTRCTAFINAGAPNSEKTDMPSYELVSALSSIQTLATKDSVEGGCTSHIQQVSGAVMKQLPTVVPEVLVESGGSWGAKAYKRNPDFCVTTLTKKDIQKFFDLAKR
jgi:hypothetical protein